MFDIQATTKSFPALEAGHWASNQCRGLIADFEKGVWKAVRSEFPTTSIKGCAFHFGQAVFRKVTKLGLKTTYTSRGPEYRYILSLMALPFLPAGQIQSAFNTLVARATSPVLQQLVTYMENTWIRNSVWQPRNWCVFQTSIRTNNDVEGWHTRINIDISTANVSFYILVPALQREYRVIELTYRLVSEQQILRDQRTRYRDTEGRLHAMWDSYDDEQISASQLLRECGQIYGPPSD